jgi:hypothetical protein
VTADISSSPRRDLVADAIVAALLLTAAGGTLLGCPGEADAYSRSVALTRASGYLALVAASCALCATPLARVVAWVMRRARPGVGASLGPLAWSRRVRRAFGIAAASCAIVHSSLALAAVPGAASALVSSPRLRFGLGALLILTLLLLTSFPRLVTRMRIAYWKELHRLAYVAWPFAMIHALLGPFASLTNLLWLAGLTLGIGMLRVIPTAARDRDQLS